MKEQEDSLISLASDIAKGSRLLMDQEMVLLRAEMSKNWKEAKRAVPYFFLGSVAAITVSVLVTEAFAEWLVQHRGFSLGIARVFISFLGLMSVFVLFAFGKMHVRKVSATPKESINSIKENLKCLTN